MLLGGIGKSGTPQRLLRLHLNELVPSQGELRVRLRSVCARTERVIGQDVNNFIESLIAPNVRFRHRNQLLCSSKVEKRTAGVRAHL